METLTIDSSRPHERAKSNMFRLVVMFAAAAFSIGSSNSTDAAQWMMCVTFSHSFARITSSRPQPSSVSSPDTVFTRSCQPSDNSEKHSDASTSERKRFSAETPFLGRMRT